ncbi:MULTISPECIES: amidase family protein [unclassified Bradyrhizobium]|uniref:amidase family protein n=1 Tax=unclassified Bradyrhizobium TaxID=2631580 RepID=UPI001FF838EC|nr:MULTISPECIES: amidase family protein [unclassified Bradyrhizobium]MCK1298401.1 allophanate hydrolase [Bradyrhizobium sp. 37]MCK1769444.1 allophanate hydrolase [Bradyrhizobium sp. 134]
MKQELSDLSVRELALRLRQGEIELTDVVDDVLAARAENASNPMFITVVPEQDLRKRADELASLPAAIRSKMPLYGVPFVVKDNIDVVGYATTAGCPEYAYRPARNAFVVDRLLEAGAMLVAKANLDQFATGLTGMRSVYGFPQNPYSPDHIVGGSSSGSGVAIACRTAHFSLGTDTAGSGRIPAGFLGIYGFRPSGGLLSNSGVVPSGRMLDSCSVFCRNPDDLRLVMSSAGVYDAADPFAKEVRGRPRSLKDPTVGVIELKDEYFLGDAEAKRVYAAGIERLRGLGYSIEQIDYDPFAEISDMTYKPELMAERAAVLGPFIEAHPAGTYSPVVKAALMNSTDCKAVDAYRILHRRTELVRQIELDAWSKVDVLALPTAPTIHKRSMVERDPAYASTSLGLFVNFAPHLGLPALSVPNVMRSDGLPSGLMFVGQPGDDGLLIDVAQQFAH